MPDFIIKDEVYSILKKYFDGDIININKKTLSGLKKGKYKKKEIEKISSKVYKTLKNILRLQEENPVEYAEVNWIYPQEKEE